MSVYFREHAPLTCSLGRANSGMLRDMASLPTAPYKSACDTRINVPGRHYWISISCVTYDTFLASAGGLMSSLRRLKTCRLRRTVKKSFIALIHYSLSQRTCTERRHPSFRESFCVQNLR